MNDEFERYQLSLDKERKDSESKSGPITSNLFSMKSSALATYIRENIKSADLKWSLFCAACNSYRFDSVLKPFPPFFVVQEDKKQIERLRELIELCPSMSAILKQLIENTLPGTLVDLLYWVLIHLNEPSFKYIPKEEHQDVISQVSSVMPAALPDYIFRVTYSNKHQQKFMVTRSDRSTRFAFHGSRLDNFYSIINHGLQVSLNKIAAFGPGIYLSSEMGVSLPYSPRGFTWGSSLFGSHISIVGLCEVIDHPDVRSENESKKTTSNIFDICDNQSVPGKYFIVENSDLVRICYLLVYSSDDNESVSLLESPTLLGWIKRHKTLTFVVAYVILLLGIGSSNSSLLYKYYRRFIRRFDDGR